MLLSDPAARENPGKRRSPRSGITRDDEGRGASKNDAMTSMSAARSRADEHRRRRGDAKRSLASGHGRSEGQRSGQEQLGMLLESFPEVGPNGKRSRQVAQEGEQDV